MVDGEATWPVEGLPIPDVGGHRSVRHGACVMEYAALLSGADHSDRPAPVHPALADMCRATNDAIGDEARAGLVRLVPALIGTERAGARSATARAADDDRVDVAVAAVLDRADEAYDLIETSTDRSPEPPSTIPARIDPGAGGGTAVLDRPTAPSPGRAFVDVRIRFAHRLRRRRSDAEIVALLEETVHAVRGALDLPPVPTGGPRPR